MVKTVYYCESCEGLTKAIQYLKKNILCWIEVELIEMNYITVEIVARHEDMKIIETVLAPYV